MKRPGLGRLITSIILLIVIFCLIASVFGLILYLGNSMETAENQDGLAGFGALLCLLVILVYSVIVAYLIFVCSILGFLLPLTARKLFNNLWMKVINICMCVSHGIFVLLCVLEFITIIVVSLPWLIKLLLMIIYIL